MFSYLGGLYFYKGPAVIRNMGNFSIKVIKSGANYILITEHPINLPIIYELSINLIGSEVIFRDILQIHINTTIEVEMGIYQYIMLIMMKQWATSRSMIAVSKL